MTKIHISGMLGQIFGREFNLSVCSASSALNGIEANRQGFLRKIIELGNKGLNYAMIIDGQSVDVKEAFHLKRKIKSIHIVPVLIGFGAGAGAVVAQLVVQFLISAAVSIGISFLMAALNKQAAPPQVNASVGGNASSLDALGRSYIFSNKQNSETQGSTIPLGYGRLRVSSKIIIASVKDYSTNEYATNEFERSYDYGIIPNYLTD